MVHVNTSLKPVSLPVPATSRTRQATSSPATSGTSPNTGAADFLALFTSKTAPTPVVQTPPTPPAPTAQSVFGPNPWVANPTGQGADGASFSYNPYYFATPQTAAIVAQMVGGTVVQSNQFTPNGGPFQQQQPNNMVQLPDGRMINPGLVASFYDHGYSQSYVDMMVACEVKNA